MEKPESIAQIKARLAGTSDRELDAFIQLYRGDARSGVKALVEKAHKRQAFLADELQRLEQMRQFEHKYQDRGLICGIDEAGRGPLAGPVVAAAVILPEDANILYLNDSKKLSAKRREELFEEIKEKAIAYGIGMAEPKRIDEINILQADYEAMADAVRQLDPQPAMSLNDAVHIPQLAIPQISIIHGDAQSVSIAAASVLAKVTRDRIMEAYDKEYPKYGFAGHKGYGSAAHIEALKKYGPCPIHRRSFIGNFVEV